MAKAQNYQINKTTWRVGISQNLSMTRPVLVWNLSQKWPWWQSQKPNKMHSHLQKRIQSSSNRRQQPHIALFLQETYRIFGGKFISLPYWLGQKFVLICINIFLNMGLPFVSPGHWLIPTSISLWSIWFIVVRCPRIGPWISLKSKMLWEWSHVHKIQYLSHIVPARRSWSTGETFASQALRKYYLRIACIIQDA